MRANFFKINEEKTECIIFSKITDDAHKAPPCWYTSCQITRNCQNTWSNVRHEMSLDQQITSLSRLVHMYIRKIKLIKVYISDCVLKTLIQSTVTVRLDYCNSLYYGLTQKSTRKLQLTQNAAAHLIAKIS